MWRGTFQKAGWSISASAFPTHIADFVPAEREVIFHAENGVIGVGPAPAPDKVNPFLINASTTHVTLRTGGSYVHHADSFAIARGGHLDLCVLGAFEVAENGDIANWARSADEPVKQVGGAMDLAIGAKRLWVVMDHTTREGAPRLRHRCTYPLTAKAVVKRVYTNLAVLDVTPRGFVVRDMIPGLTLEALQARTEARTPGRLEARNRKRRTHQRAEGEGRSRCVVDVSGERRIYERRRCLDMGCAFEGRRGMFQGRSALCPWTYRRRRLRSISPALCSPRTVRS